MRLSWRSSWRTLRRGRCKTREDCERDLMVASDRIEELEKDLAESEANSAEVPGLRETYIKTI